MKCYVTFSLFLSITVTVHCKGLRSTYSYSLYLTHTPCILYYFYEANGILIIVYRSTIKQTEKGSTEDDYEVITTK